MGVDRRCCHSRPCARRRPPRTWRWTDPRPVSAWHAVAWLRRARPTRHPACATARSRRALLRARAGRHPARRSPCLAPAAWEPDLSLHVAPPPSPPNALRSRHADAVGADKPSKRWHSQDELRSRVLLERERARSSTPQGSARAHTPIGYQGRLVVGVPALPCPGHRLCWAVAGCFSPLHERSLAPWQPRGLPTALTMASASMLVFAWLSLCRSAPTAGRTSALSGVPTRDPGSSSATHAAYTTHPTRRHGAR